VAPYALVVPGGGTGHPGAADAVARFHRAATALAAAGIPTVFVGPVAPGTAAAPGVVEFASLPQSQLAARLREAALVVVNGGSTLLQAIACGRACIAVPIAKDQHERIRRCTAAAVASAAPLDSDAIAATALALWRDAPARAALAARAAALGLQDGVEVALGGIAASLRMP
jgi:predicted glycosyltransferase